VNGAPEWLPSLIEFTGDWNAFVGEVYDCYCADFVRMKASFKGVRIAVRRHPESNGKGSGFWHCVSEGSMENVRTPDLQRCQRIGWIRAIIDNSDKQEVEHWTNRRHGETNHLLWLLEEYLVVLVERNGYFLLKTAYRTDRPHTKRKLREERNRSKNG